MAPAGPAGADEGAAIRGAGGPDAVAGRYLVVLRDTAAPREREVPAVARQLADRFSGTLGYIYTAALHGFSISLGEAQARRLAADPAVAYVEQDQRVRVSATQRPTPSWDWTGSTSAPCR